MHPRARARVDSQRAMQRFLDGWDTLRKSKEESRTTPRASTSRAALHLSDNPRPESRNISNLDVLPAAVATSACTAVGEITLQVPCETVSETDFHADSLNLLSDELLIPIFALLTPKELCIVAQVSKLNVFRAKIFSLHQKSSGSTTMAFSSQRQAALVSALSTKLWALGA